MNEYYKSNEWQLKRAARLELNRNIFGGWCERCGAFIANTVHHRVYKNIGLEHPFDLEAICEMCHSILHPDNEELKK